MLTTTRPQKAESGVGLEQCPVGCAAQQAVITVHELIVVPVEWDAKVWTAVQKGMDGIRARPYHDHARSADKKPTGLADGKVVEAAQLQHHR